MDRPRRPGATLLLVSVVAHLGLTSLSAASDATNGAHIAARLPRIVYEGGRFVRHPRVITVTFGGDDPALVGTLERFGGIITTTDWWHTVTAGYCVSPGDCVGTGRPGAAFRLTDALPAHLHAVDLSALLRRHIAAGRFGVLDADSLLLVYLPSRVELQDAYVARFCHGGARAFHRALRVADAAIGYAVLPRCGDAAALTATASHELLEMAMGPDTARGFAFADDWRSRGFTAAGREIMDPCGFVAGDVDVIASGFRVRRAWSNEAASRGDDPCVPSAADRPFIAMTPREPAVRLLRDGESIVVTLDASANRRVRSWSVSAIDLTGAQEGRTYVDLTLDRTIVRPGDTATLRITRRAAHPSHRSIAAVVSTLDGQRSLWPIAVSTR